MLASNKRPRRRAQAHNREIMQPLPAIVVLAAGLGSRFRGTSHKLAQPLGASTVFGCTLANALATNLPLVVVTTEPLAPIARGHVASRDVVLLPMVGSTTDEPLGMGFSIATGVAARPDASGWLVLPADMPHVTSDTILEVARRLADHPVVYAQHHGRRGHPVAFSAELFTELATLTGDEGARRLVARYPAHGVDVKDAGVLLDVDTQSDLEHARHRGMSMASQR